MTDGADVVNIREIVQMAGRYKGVAEVHTFGVGGKASPGLIIELAEISGGSYNFVLDDEK